ncbi:hypothetical protein BOW34_00785 [Solemya velum gill symbiont]|nr:hypothetical protein BOW27_00775 [Solemya velum gill symbiont]OOZ28724.1 hypothetical protein BOW33_08990 [Solemya velum gill symbiont]OOZ33422.1 hypothetical protein BOW34_00785 [Solemya velum gill symbiont]
MAISDWPSAERPREKLLQRGATALSDAELLAIFLRTGVKGKSAVDLARELLSNFDGLRNLLAADRQRFCEAAGLGDAKFAQLQAVVEMTRRYQGEKIKRGAELTSPGKAFSYLQAEIGSATRELFGVLFLDTRHRVICFETLFSGTIDGASVHPREVVKRDMLGQFFWFRRCIWIHKGIVTGVNDQRALANAAEILPATAATIIVINTVKTV